MNWGNTKIVGESKILSQRCGGPSIQLVTTAAIAFSLSFSFSLSSFHSFPVANRPKERQRLPNSETDCLEIFPAIGVVSQGAPPDTSCLPSSSVRPGKYARPNTQPRPVSPSTSIAIRHTWQEQSPAKRKDGPRVATFLRGPGCHEDTAVGIVSVQAWLAGGAVLAEGAMTR